MTLEIEAEQIPLMMDIDGVMRVGETRVTLDTLEPIRITSGGGSHAAGRGHGSPLCYYSDRPLVSAFSDGATAEEIVQQYPPLRLGDVYAVLGYYLRRRPDIEVYLRQRQALTTEVREQNESRFDPQGVRDRLLAMEQNSLFAGCHSERVCP
jgi:hypothetical protein